VRGPAAIIGLNSAVPTAPLLATGAIGTAQTERLFNLLSKTGQRGLFRLVLVHHPMAEGVVSRRKALIDAAAVRAVLAAAGAELVLWGHAHRTALAPVPGPHGLIPALGIASASRYSESVAYTACWHHLVIEEANGGWQVRVTVRRLATDGRMQTA
jgi:3',5'-cyclic AMP phosphodiesterase CpdA